MCGLISDLFESMTRRYPEDRVRLEDIKHHPWFAKQTDSKEAFQKALLDRIHQVNETFKQHAYKTIGAVKQKHSASQTNLESEPQDKSTAEVPEHVYKMMLDHKQKTRKLRLELGNGVTMTSSQCSSKSSKSSKSQDEDQCAGDVSPSDIGAGALKKATAGDPVKTLKPKGVLAGSNSLQRPEICWSSSSSDNDDTSSNPN